MPLQIVQSAAEQKLRRKQRNRVKFDKIHLREYELTLGDNPCVSSGPAISLDWTYDPNTETTVQIEEFEASRMHQRKSRVDLVIPRHLREQILFVDCGVSRDEIATCIREIRATKERRKKTKKSLNYVKAQEKLERIRLKLERVVGVRKSYAEELELLWQKARLAQHIQGKKFKLNRTTGTDLKHHHQAYVH